MISSSLCDYSDAYIRLKETITSSNTEAAGAAVNNANKKIFKNCAAFTDCITGINNTNVEDAQKFDVVMPMHNLIEYSDAYSKTSRNLWQYYGDKLAVDNNNNFIDFPDNNSKTASFKSKQKIIGQTRNNGTKDVEIMVLAKYLSSFWRTLGMPLINSEICLQLIWSKRCILAAGTAYN